MKIENEFVTFLYLEIFKIIYNSAKGAEHSCTEVEAALKRIVDFTAPDAPPATDTDTETNDTPDEPAPEQDKADADNAATGEDTAPVKKKKR